MPRREENDRYMKMRFSLDTKWEPISDFTNLVKAIAMLLLVVLICYVTYAAGLPATVDRYLNDRIECLPLFDALVELLTGGERKH